jgi:hypothetical protein
MTALLLARAFKIRGNGERLLMLSVAPGGRASVATIQDQEVGYREARGMTMSSRASSGLLSSAFRGFLDIFTAACAMPVTRMAGMT